MHDFLFGYYFTRFEVLVILFLVGGVGGAIYWGLRRRWRNKLETLEQKLDKCDPERIRALHEHLQSVVAHEFVKALRYILAKSSETLEGLEKGQNTLREKQEKIVAKAYELTQHAFNIQDVFAPERDEPPKELLNMRRFVEGVLSELHPYAESKGVTLVTNLADVEPTALNRDFTLLALGNVIHNAIRYSHRGGVVKTVLSLKVGVIAGTEKAICVDVKDTGKGIPEEDRDKIFELRVRGDGLIEPGSGLGLYCAREAARRQGGDVILVSSSLNQGSVFRIIFPYGDD
jgi:signal transduction histidine kinase